MILVVMGVSGSGKSTIGHALARRLGSEFLEGDDLHPAANLARMARGEPLDEGDRLPWIEALAERIGAADEAGRGLVVACSALRRSHRDRLRAAAADLGFVHLAGAPETVRARVAARTGHFMPPGLIDSQFETLEPPDGEPAILALDASAPVAELVDTAERWARARR